MIHSAINKFNVHPSQAMILYLSIGGISVKLANSTFHILKVTADKVSAKLRIIQMRCEVNFFLTALYKAMEVVAIHNTDKIMKPILEPMPPFA